MIEVMAAVIVQDNKILICQRPAGKSCALLWEFPGGKIERRETAEDCVVRECKEELDIELTVIRKLTEVYYEYPDRTVHIQFFLCNITHGEIKKNEHNAIVWTTPDELIKYDFCPADAGIIRNMKKLLEQY